MRKIIFDILNALYPSYAMGQHKGLCNSPYLVIKFNTQSRSVSMALGAFQSFEVLVYIPDSSITGMEDKLDEVTKALTSQGFESVNSITPDYHDAEVQAFMRSAQFRIPTGLN
jgi:hypothetical protein